MKKINLSTFVDTMVDVKSFDSKEHKSLTSRGNDNVLKNDSYLA